jgi:hypothetical protein
MGSRYAWRRRLQEGFEVCKTDKYNGVDDAMQSYKLKEIIFQEDNLIITEAN